METREKTESKRGRRQAPRTKKEDSQTFTHDFDAGGVGVTTQN
jgi:hypothetical protein